MRGDLGVDRGEVLVEAAGHVGHARRVARGEVRRFGEVGDDVVEPLRARLVEKTSQIATAVAEVQQLQRITRLGRTIDLARRVSTREDKWYQVNWQQEGDTAGIEEGLAQSMNVDLERLNKSYSKAQEIRNLRARIAEERERVAELTRRYQEKLAPQRPQGEESGPKEERPWWQRWNIVR